MDVTLSGARGFFKAAEAMRWTLLDDFWKLVTASVALV